MRFALVLITLILSAACQRAGQGALDRLHPCGIDEGPPDAYCGTYRVFENRATATGRAIDLKIVVAPALRRDPRPDPLFIFEGGPGGGGRHTRVAADPDVPPLPDRSRHRADRST